MICPIVLFPLILNDSEPRFQGHGAIFRPIDALNVLCAQLTHNLFAIAKFLSCFFSASDSDLCVFLSKSL